MGIAAALHGVFCYGLPTLDKRRACGLLTSGWMLARVYVYNRLLL